MQIFRCVQEIHKGFYNNMSVQHIVSKFDPSTLVTSFYNNMSVQHILKQKQCFPHGCFYFKWHCKRLNKGRQCPRGYHYVGKNCSGCRYFYEEKIHNFPELQITESEYTSFLKNLEEFEDWLSENLNRKLEIHGTIHGVKPRFRKRIYGKSQGIYFSGFMLIFQEIYLGQVHMEDYVYALISSKTFSSLKFGKGDVLNARGTLTLDRGRLILRKLHYFDIEQRGDSPLWSESQALVARETATRMPFQSEGCVQCPFGALIDVEDLRREPRQYRELYCLKGLRDWRDCHVRAEYCGLDIEANEAAHPGCDTDRTVRFVNRL